MPAARRLAGPVLALLLTLAPAWAGGNASDTGTEADRWLTGYLLVASPAMPDGRFRETVIYIVRHDADGAMGLIVNRPIGPVPLAEILAPLGHEADTKASVVVHFGGPVARREAFVLHSADYRGEATLTVNDDFAMTSDTSILRDIAAGRGPARVLFAVGYSGWAPGQLEREIETGGWRAIAGDSNLVFERPAEQRWQRAMSARGRDL